MKALDEYNQYREWCEALSYYPAAYKRYCDIRQWFRQYYASAYRSELEAVKEENLRLKAELADILKEIEKHSSEHIKSGGHRFYGIGWKQIAEIFAEHGVHQELPF